jgi:uncharacterized membrane protein YhaH (DUF805 family)
LYRSESPSLRRRPDPINRTTEIKENGMNWYIGVWKKFAVFEGRAARTEYWMFFLFNILIGIVLAVADLATGTFSEETGLGLLGGLYSLAVLIPSIAVTVRRLHDTGRSGWWVLVGLIPLLGVLVLLVFMVLDSEPGENAYGPNPKGAMAWQPVKGG